MSGVRGALAALSVAVLMAAAPQPAAAEGFYNRDLGEGGSPEACLLRARQAIETYARQNGTPGAAVTEGAWTVGGYDLLPGAVDVQIACPYRDSIAVIVLLTGYSAGDEPDRTTVVDEISRIWDTLGQPGAPAGK